jgi:hypothetical protein
MKKTTMIAALIALCAIGASAADVYSANVVGYTKLDIAADNFTMLGINFQAVGGGSLTINELFAEPVEGAFTGGEAFAVADQIRVWNPATTGYKNYFFGDWEGAWGAEYDRLWYWQDDDDDPTEDPLAPGAAVWYLSKGMNETQVTIAGEVKSDAATITLAAGNFTMVANPFPVEVGINEFFAEPEEGTFTGGEAFAVADQIRVWNPATTGYKNYFFGDWEGAWGEEYDRLWYWQDDDDDPTTDTIPVGGAVWYLSRGASDVTFAVESPVQ